jgi:putative hydrolase of the HAD superfamily
VNNRYLIWDFDGTLAYRSGRSWSHTLAEVAQQHAGLPHITADAMRPHVMAGFPWHTPERQHGPWASADSWWDALLPVFEQAFHFVCGVSAAEARGLAGRVRPAYLNPARWNLFEDTEAGLSALSNHGWQHVILSNHVPELPRLVDALGLTKHIRQLFNSAETGFEKPHSQAFLNVVAELPPSAMLRMIGDNLEADVNGAGTVGIPAILLRNRNPAAPICCQDMEELCAMLDSTP